MSEFSKLLDQFKHHEEDLRDLGNQLVERYPQSKTLLQLSRDLSSAIDGVDALRQKLQDTLQTAEQEEKLKTDLLDQMGKQEDLYGKLSPGSQEKLAEFLLQNKTGLADRETLLGFIAEALGQKSTEDLIAEFTKEEIQEIGALLGEPEDETFDSYQAGAQLLTDHFNNPEKRKALLQDLAEFRLDHDPEDVLKGFFQKAFQP